MAEEPDRLSQLPDEVLQHILRLAPSREALTTAVLSRRWRGLWPPPTGAVKIDIPSAGGDNLPSHAWLRAAEEALAASHGPVERLAIDVGQGCHDDDDVVGDVLTHPASRGVQDVRIYAHASRDAQRYFGDDNELCSWRPTWFVGEFQFGFACVPSAALRVLHITNCTDLTPTTWSFTFPCLEVLRLRRCNVDLQRLQDMVAAAPRLTALQLEHVFLPTEARQDHRSLCCHGITTLVLLNCFRDEEESEDAKLAVELDVPGVQHFKYRGKIDQFTLRSPLPDVRRAYLHILASGRRTRDDETTCEIFWSFLKNFSGTKVLKLKHEWPIEYVAALDWRSIRDVLIGGGNSESDQPITFCVQHLEIDARYDPESKDVGVAIGNLLQCCPALHDLRLKLNTAAQHRRRNWSTFLQTKAQLEFHRSTDHFRHRRDPPVPSCGSVGELEVSDIPGLTDRWFHFSCLQLHLKRLSLQFRMDKDNPNCIGVQLVQFFIERGTALEEMYIDDGNLKLWEHMNCKITGYAPKNQQFPEHHVLAAMSRALSVNQFSSSSKISGRFHPHKLDVRRTNPWCASRGFTVLPLADA